MLECESSGQERARRSNQSVCCFCYTPTRVALIMPKQIDPFWEGYITALFDANYSYSAIIEACKKRNFMVSKCGISSVLNKKGKGRLGLITKGKKRANPRPATTRTPDVIRKLKVLISGGNPATQSVIANRLGISLKTVNTIINKDLNMEKRHKSKVHKLLPRHIAEYRTDSRKL
ncbi:hypothetical protein L9F63_011456 [Diploptera punctata]|uniref:Transposase n=1 Tax=Diploptera punctata TaxID=6984 RepID=A0AAD8AFE5_DIPPU|nr:hypothetical protein L9F63_011456 [Diploptera punctata]